MAEMDTRFKPNFTSAVTQWLLLSEFGGRLVNKAELARLEATLKSLPTTEAEDTKLLEGMHVSK